MASDADTALSAHRGASISWVAAPMRTLPIPNRRTVAPPGDGFVVWPRRRSTGIVLGGLIITQSTLFLWVTQPSFFFLDDFLYFKLAEERSFLLGLFTPILGVYPAPGDRLLSFVLQKAAPLNFTVARGILLVFLAGTTFLLWQLVRMLSRSDRWWTVALLVPFALSLTLVIPIAWWSAGLPIIPALFFTVIAISAWFRSYVEPNVRAWVWVAALAVAAAGAFYVKFLLIPVYLVFLRLVIFPHLFGLRSRIRDLLAEAPRWMALAVPPAAFLAVWVLSGIAGRSASTGSRPYAAYFATVWFRAFVPAAFLNGRIDGPMSSVASWAVVVAGELLFVAIVTATWIRSSLAPRAWALFLFVFCLNTGVVGTDRLPYFGMEIAYALRYYPEIVLFLPLVLALCLRQGDERRTELAWEHTTAGQAAVVLVAAMYFVSFGLWGPGAVSDYDGVAARAWYENLRSDVAGLAADGRVPRIVDSETPQSVMEDWMAPDNRVSTVLSLAHVRVAYDRVSNHTYLVRSDGHLAPAVFQAITAVVSGGTISSGVLVPGGTTTPAGTCLAPGGTLRYRPEPAIVDGRLAMRVSYSTPSSSGVRVRVDAHDPDRGVHYTKLSPFRNDAELVDLASSRVYGLQLQLAAADRICIRTLEIGTLASAGP
jgi:hypothetical protein